MQRIEVITRGERRRVWTTEQKRDIVAESLDSGTTPTEVGRKYGITSGQLYTWRRQMLAGRLDEAPRSAPSFARVEVVAAPRQLEAPEPGASNPEPAPPPASTGSLRPDGLIEIALPDGISVRVDAQVDSRALRRVLAALNR